MGSGVFLAVVVVMWFVVLVPMVLTRRDAAMEKAAGDNLSPSARVLTRRGAVGASRKSRRRSIMSLSESSPSLAADQAGADDAYSDKPGVAENFDDMIDTGVHARYVDDVDDVDEHASEVQVVRDHRRTDSVREKTLARRRRTLLTLAALVAVTLVLAVFVSPWVWVANVIFDVMGAAYLWHLRGEARREEERRLTRAARANRPRRKTGFETRHSDGTRQSFAAGAFIASDDIDDDVVSLDDEDVAFYDLADAPVADNVDLSGHEYFAEGDIATEYDYDDQSYGIQGATPANEGHEGDGWGMPKAVGA